MSDSPTKSEISIWRDFFGSADLELLVAEDDVLAAAEVEPADDPVLGDLLAGSLVDLLVADPVRRPLFELVEVDALVRGGRIQADGDVHQSETEGPLPDRAWHARKLPAQSRSTTLLQPFVTLRPWRRTLRRLRPRPARRAGRAGPGRTVLRATCHLELGLSVWLRPSGTSLLEARTALRDPSGILEVCGARPGHRAGPPGRTLPAVRRREPGRLHRRSSCAGSGRAGGGSWRRPHRGAPSWPSRPGPKPRRSGRSALEAEGRR